MFDFWNQFLANLNLFQERAHASIADDDESLEELADSTPDFDGPRIRHRGAWAGSSSLSNPERDTDFAKRIGINRLDIIVNDHSALRKPTHFDLRSEDRIIRLAQHCHDRGIAVHLMTWTMPHPEYIKGMGRMLPDLAKEVRAVSVVLDGEEPQTQAVKANGRRYRRKDYDASAQLLELEVMERLHAHGIRMGLTGIRYAPVSPLAYLAAICDYWLSQAYATNTSGANPKTVCASAQRLWEGKFGKSWRAYHPGMEPDHPSAIAAYRQTGIKGHTVRQAMGAVVDGADDFSDTIVAWGLNSIRASPTVAGFIKSLEAYDAFLSAQDAT